MSKFLWNPKRLFSRNKELIILIIGSMKSINIFSFTMPNNLQYRIYYYWLLLISLRQLPGIFNFKLNSPSLFYSPGRCHSCAWTWDPWSEIGDGQGLPVECCPPDWPAGHQVYVAYNFFIWSAHKRGVVKFFDDVCQVARSPPAWQWNFCSFYH